MPRPIKKQYTGGVVDTSLSEAAIQSVRALSGDEKLIEEIGLLVGRCKQKIDRRETAPQTNEVLSYAENTLDLIKKLNEHIGLMPEDIKVYMSEVLWNKDQSFYGDMEHKLLDTLRTFSALTEISVKKIKKVPKSKGGKKPKTLEHGLLSDVTKVLEELGLQKIEAGLEALKILKEVGIRNIPYESENINKVVNEYRKKLTPPK